MSRTKLLAIGAKASLLAALAKRPELDVYAMSPRVAPGLVPAAGSPGTLVEHFRYDGGAKLNLKVARQVRQGLTTLRPDVVHAFYARPLSHAVIAAATLRRRPSIVSYRGITRVPGLRDPSEYLSHLNPLVSAHACESEAVREALVAGGIPREHCFVTYNFLSKNSPAAGPSATADRESTLASLGIPPDALVVATVANMRRLKGIDLLLKAAIDCHNVPNLYWLLIGKILDQQIYRLAQHPRLQDRVRLLGYRTDAQRLIQAADLFVLPSRQEALSLALLEAMDTGICPVVSDAGGMKEAVRHQVDGLVVPSGDVAALGNTIRLLAADPVQRRRYAESAQQRCADEFTPEKVVERFMPLYESVLRAA